MSWMWMDFLHDFQIDSHQSIELERFCIFLEKFLLNGEGKRLAYNCGKLKTSRGISSSSDLVDLKTITNMANFAVL